MEIDSSCISGSCDRRSASAIIRESGILRAVTIYVLTLIASVIDLGFMCFGHPDIGGFISTAAGIIAPDSASPTIWFACNHGPNIT